MSWEAFGPGEGFVVFLMVLVLASWVESVFGPPWDDGEDE